MEKIMTNPGFYGIRTRILKHLDHESVEKLCTIWSEDDQLRRTSCIKFMTEFGDRKFFDPWKKEVVEGIVRTGIPGWDEAIKKVSAKASLAELKEIKNSLFATLTIETQFCRQIPVHAIALSGSVKLMEFIFHTSFDMNSTGPDRCEDTPFQLASLKGSLEMVRLMIQSSKEQDIDLNAGAVYDGATGFHLACDEGEIDIVKFILENYEEFGIDIKKQDYEGRTPLDLLKQRLDFAYYEDELDVEECRKLIHQLEEEYAKIDASNPKDWKVSNPK